MFDSLLFILAIATAVPSAVFLVECLAAMLPRRSREGGCRSATFAVVMPAHNEEGGIGETIRGLRDHLEPSVRLLVVADNCTDRTADVARTSGAEVVERTDPARRGKGYAMDFGVRHLAADPPRVVVFMDADTVVRRGSLSTLAAVAADAKRPAQAVYLMDPPASATAVDQASALAFTVKNLVRPRGMASLGLPCHLTGTGMAWPWEAMGRVDLATGAIVEDMQLGIDATISGFGPLLVEDVVVGGQLPQGQRTAMTQRTRWEHGHLSVLLRQGPRLAFESIRQRRPALFGLGLDLCVPPLALLVLLLATVAVATGAWAVRGGSATPLIVAVSSIGSVALGVLIAWRRFARHIPAWALLAAPWYVLWKVPIYFKFLVSPEKRWVRTERNPQPISPEVPDSHAGHKLQEP